MAHQFLKSGVENGNIEHVMQYTCDLIKGDCISSLEHTWLQLCAKLGESHSLHLHQWMDVCSDLLHFLREDVCNIKKAFEINAKLLLLYHRNAYFLEFKLPILREKIIGHFPENGLLTMKGIEMFNDILPLVEDEKLFAHRILCGVLKLESDPDVLRLAVEYFMRKKLTVHLPSRMFCPFIEEQERGEIAWFLWGALLLFHKNHSALHQLWQLFCMSNTRLEEPKKGRGRKTLKSSQFMTGFLNGAVCFSRYNVVLGDLTWSAGDTEFIRGLQENGVLLWNVNNQIETESKNTEADADVLSSFQPRATNVGVGAQRARRDSRDSREVTKIIKLKNAHKARADSFEDEDQFTQVYRQSETHHVDSGRRGISFSEARK